MNESVEVNGVSNPPYSYRRPGFRTADLSERHAHPLEMLEPANFAGSKAASGSKSKEVLVHDSSLRFEPPADRPCSLQVRSVGLCGGMTTLCLQCHGSVSRPVTHSVPLGRRSSSSQASRRDVALGLVFLPMTASVAKAADNPRLPQGVEHESDLSRYGDGHFYVSYMANFFAGYLTVADKLIHTLEESLDTLSKGGNEAQVWMHRAYVPRHRAQDGLAMQAPQRIQLPATQVF